MPGVDRLPADHADFETDEKRVDQCRAGRSSRLRNCKKRRHDNGAHMRLGRVVPVVELGRMSRGRVHECGRSRSAGGVREQDHGLPPTAFTKCIDQAFGYRLTHTRRHACQCVDEGVLGDPGMVAMIAADRIRPSGDAQKRRFLRCPVCHDTLPYHIPRADGLFPTRHHRQRAAGRKKENLRRRLTFPRWRSPPYRE